MRSDRDAAAIALAPWLPMPISASARFWPVCQRRTIAARIPIASISSALRMAAPTSAWDFSAASLASAAGRRTTNSISSPMPSIITVADHRDHRIGRVQQDQRRAGISARTPRRSAGRPDRWR